MFCERCHSVTLLSLRAVASCRRMGWGGMCRNGSGADAHRLSSLRPLTCTRKSCPVKAHAPTSSSVSAKFVCPLTFTYVTHASSPL